MWSSWVLAFRCVVSAASLAQGIAASVTGCHGRASHRQVAALAYNPPRRMAHILRGPQPAFDIDPLQQGRPRDSIPRAIRDPAPDVGRSGRAAAGRVQCTGPRQSADRQGRLRQRLPGQPAAEAPARGRHQRSAHLVHADLLWRRHAGGGVLLRRARGTAAHRCHGARRPAQPARRGGCHHRGLGRQLHRAGLRALWRPLFADYEQRFLKRDVQGS